MGDVFVVGTGAALPRRKSVAAAVARGDCDARDAERGEYLEIAIAEDADSAPDFAVSAARTALRRAAGEAADVGQLLHAVVMHSGLDGWNSAAYIQREILAPGCLITEIRGGCGVAMIGLEMAADRLRGRHAQPLAIVTAADRWPQPHFDRWRGGGGVIFGDGGAALIVSRESGFARLAAIVTHTDPALERMHRGHEPFWPNGADQVRALDLTERTRAFFRSDMPKAAFFERHAALVANTLGDATERAGVPLRDVQHLILPFDGAATFRREYIEPYGLDIDRTTWEFDRRTGHLGAGDPIASLNHLAESGRLAPGDRVLMVGEGAGWTMTGAVLEVLHAPDTTARP